MPDAPPPRSEPSPRWRGRFSISATIAASITLVVLLSVGTVLGLSIWSARENTLSLLADKAELITELAVGRIETHLRPAEVQARMLGDALVEGVLDVTAGQGALAAYLDGALSTTPQIRSIGYIDDEFQLFAVLRSPDGNRLVRADMSADSQALGYLDALEGITEPVWGSPTWRAELGETVLNVRYPVRRDGVPLAVTTALVSLRALSEFTAELDPQLGANVFVLYDRQWVLAHPLLAGDFPGLTADRPLPAVAGFTDPVLSRIWNTETRQDTLDLGFGEDLESFTVEAFQERYVFLVREVGGLGARPIQIGTYFRADEVGVELQRLLRTALIGVGFALLAVIVAQWIGRRIARPIVELSRSASRVGDLDLSQVDDLPGSMFRELDDQARAFNSMLRGLHWFETYVPKTLVKRLVGYGEAGELASVEREVTVMFTDIAGFTSISADQPAGAVAAFLNHHFAVVGACVEAEGGTVDKYIGDSLMAFWNAPDPQGDHAERACRAAAAIARAVVADNVVRRARGEAPVRLRIGLHRGSVVVGNIGAPGRINYTIVGEAVNVGQRLEQLGKVVAHAQEETVVLASAAVCADLPEGFQPRPVSVGERVLRGLHAPIEVFRLA